MKIVFLDTATVGKDVSLKGFEALGDFVSYPVTKPEEVLQRCEGAQIVITNKVRIQREHVEALPELKLICLAATGMDNIDLMACEERGVVVKNVKGYSTDSVAQLTIAMVLSLMCKLKKQDEFGKNGWVHDELFTNLDNPFHELAGKTWAVIGLGEIGGKVASVASAFGCKALYYSTSGKNNREEYQRVDLEQALASDVISVHCPLSEVTKDLINHKNVGLLKEDAILINVARGGVVNERAIVDRFRETRLMLGFDVASVEPIHRENPLLEIAGSSRLILTPHVAWSSLEARGRLIKGILANINSWQEGAQ